MVSKTPPQSPTHLPLSPFQAQSEAKEQYVYEDMSKEQIAERDAITKKPFKVLPRVNRDLPHLEVTPSTLLERLTLCFKREKIYGDEPEMMGGSAAHISHAPFPCADLDVEFIPKMDSPGTEEYVVRKITDCIILFLYNEMCKAKDWSKNPHFKNIKFIVLPNQQRELDVESCDLIKRNYFIAIPLRNRDTKKLFGYQIKFNDVQLNFPFPHNAPMSVPNSVTIIDTHRVSVFGTRIRSHPLAKKALQEQRCVISNPKAIRALPFRFLLMQSKGIAVQNEEEVKSAALEAIQKDYDAEVKFDKSRPTNTNPIFSSAFREFHESHFYEGIDKLISSLNCFAFLLSLPDSIAAQYYQGAAKSIADGNPLAAHLVKAPLQEARNVIKYIHGVLFAEWTLDNPLTTGFRTGTHHQVTITKDKSPRYVCLGSSPLKLLSGLIHSWNALEKSCEQKQADSLTNILKALKCTSVTFTAENKVLLFKKIAGEFIKFEMHERILPALNGPQKRELTEDERLMVRYCNNYEHLAPNEIQEMARILNEKDRFAPVFIQAIVIILCRFLQRTQEKPNLPSVQAGLKLFLTCMRKEIFPNERIESTLQLFIDLFSLQQHNLRDTTYTSTLCEFIFHTLTLANKPKTYFEFSEAASKYILDQLSQFLTQLKDPEKEKLAYQCTYVIVKLLKQEHAADEVPKILGQLVLNAVERHSGKTLLTFRNRRFEILSLIRTPEIEKSKGHLKHYLVQEIAEILRHPSCGDMKQAFDRFTQILFTLERHDVRFVEAAQTIKRVQKASKNGNFITSLRQFILIVTQIDLTLATEMLQILHSMQPGAAKYNAVLVIHAHFSAKVDSVSAKKALKIFQTYLQDYIEEGLEHPNIPLTQVLTLYEMILCVVAGKLEPDKTTLDLFINSLKTTLIKGRAAIKSEITEHLKRNGNAFLKNTQKWILVLAEDQMTRSHCTSICELANEANLIDAQTIEAARKALCNISHSSLSDAIEVFYQMTDSPLFHSPWPEELEVSCVSLVGRCVDEQNEKMLETVVRYLVEKGQILRFKPKHQFVICNYLLQSKYEWAFFKIWRSHFQELSFEVAENRALANQIMNKQHLPQFHDLLYPLFIKSGSNDVYILACYIKSLLDQRKYSRSTLVKFVPDLSRCLETEEKSNGMQGDPENLAHAMLLTYIYASNVVVEEKRGLVLGYIAPLAKLIAPAQKLVSKHIKDNLCLLNDCVVMTCRKSDDPDVLKKLTEICLSGQLAKPGDTVISLIVDLLFNRKKCLLEDLRKMLVCLIQFALEKNWLQNDSSAEKKFLDFASNAEKIPFLEHLSTVFQMSGLYVNAMAKKYAEMEVKEKQSETGVKFKVKMGCVGVIFIPISRAFEKYKHYSSFTTLHALGKMFCPMPTWNVHMMTILNDISIIAKNPNSSPELIRTLFKHFKELFPLFLELSPDEARMNMIAFGSWATRHVNDQATQQEFEEFYAYTRSKGLYNNADNFRGFPDLALLHFYFDYPKSHPIGKVFETHLTMMQYTDLSDRDSQCALNAAWPLFNLRILFDLLVNQRVAPQLENNLRVTFAKISDLPQLASVYVRTTLIQVCYCLHLQHVLKKHLQKDSITLDKDTCKEYLEKVLDSYTNDVSMLRKMKRIRDMPQIAQSANFESFKNLLKHFTNAEWMAFLNPQTEKVLADHLSAFLTHYFIFTPPQQISSRELFQCCHEFYQPSMGLLRSMFLPETFESFEKKVGICYTKWLDLCRVHFETAAGGNQLSKKVYRPLDAAAE